MYDLRNVTSLRSRQVHWSKFTEHFNKLSNRYIGKATAVSINSRLLRPGSNSIWIYYTIGFWRATLETNAILLFQIENLPISLQKSKIFPY